jgi:hypothetical protein
MKFFLGPRNNLQQSGRADLAGRINNLQSGRADLAGRINNLHATSTIWPGGPNTIQYNTIQYNTIQYNTIQYNTILLYASKQYNTQDAGPQTVQLMPCTTRGAVCPRELEATGNSHTGGFPPAEGTVAVAENCSLRGAMALRSSLGQHNTIQYNTIPIQYGDWNLHVFKFPT